MHQTHKGAKGNQAESALDIKKRTKSQLWHQTESLFSKNHLMETLLPTKTNLLNFFSLFVVG